MIPNQQRWAEALTVLRMHGNGVVAHFAERDEALALAGDLAGVRRWTEIAAKLDELCKAEEEPQ